MKSFRCGLLLLIALIISGCTRDQPVCHTHAVSSGELTECGG